MSRAGYLAYVAAVAFLPVLGCGYALAAWILGPAAEVAQVRLGQPAWLTLWACVLTAAVAAGGGRVLCLWTTAAELTWGDLDRLLRVRRRVRLGLLAAVAILPVALVIVAASSTSVDGAVTWVALTGVVSAAAGVGTTLLPHLDRAWWADRVAALAVVTGVALLSAWSGPTVLAAYAAVLAATVLCARDGRPARVDRVRRWRRTPPRWELARAGRAVQAWAAAAVMLDGGPLDLERDLRSRGVRRRLPRRATWGVVLSRVIATPRCVAALPLIPLPAGVAHVWGDSAAGVVLVLITYAWSAAVTPTLDDYLDHEVLRRAFAHRPWLGREIAISTALLVILLAVLSGVLAGLGGWQVLAAVLVAALARLRRAQGRRLAGRVGALLATPAGGIPVDIANRVVAGPDMLLLGLVLLASTTPASACAVLAVTLAYLWGKRRPGR